MMSNRPFGTLYIGVTSDLPKRVWKHRTGVVDGFSKRYGTKRLVYVEEHSTMEAAIVQEKRLKKWARDWKLRLITEQNPEWRDLFEDLAP